MQQPSDFFNLHMERAGQLLASDYPDVQLGIVETGVLGASVVSATRISISTTLLLVIVNIFFRMLTHPGILPEYGDIKTLSAGHSPYPGRLPKSLDELLDVSDHALIQPADHQRALLSKRLADTAFDFLVLQLASHAQDKKRVSSHQDEAFDPNIGPAFLAADGAAISRLLAMGWWQTAGDNLISEHARPSDQEFALMFFSLSVLFFTTESLYDLPAAARIVHAQHRLREHLASPAVRAAQSGCNEAILAISAITGQPPNLDGFNGILNPASSRMLNSILA